MGFLKLGFNSKLGPRIASFSIPAKETCPGKTHACSAGTGGPCYAMGFFFRQRADAHRANWMATREGDFTTRMIAEIVAGRLEIVRPHVAGDFDTVAYARKWLSIFKRRKTAVFFFYTRSWRHPGGSVWTAMVNVFRRMAALPNVEAWFSEDRDTGPSPRVPGIRVAFSVFRESDLDLVPDHADLVFRDGKLVKRTPPTKRIKGILVCPNEQGVERQVDMTCSNCGICFSPRRKS